MKVLLTVLLAFLIYSVMAQADSLHHLDKTKQYNKKTTFDISIEPNIFSDVTGKRENSFYEMSGFDVYHVNTTAKLPLQQYAGLDLGIGVAVKKRYHFNLIGGISGNKNIAWVPAGADVKINFLNGKYSPFIHLGGGYIYNIPNASASNSEYDIISGHGCFALGGLGAAIKISKVLAINISADYRFLYNKYNYVYRGAIFDDAYLSIVPKGKVTQLNHQLGLRLALVFY